MSGNKTQRPQEATTKAFGDLCTEIRASLLRTAQMIVGDRDTAEDLVQEGLLESYVNLDSLRAADKMSAWIHSIIRNRCYNHLRRPKTTPFPIDWVERQPGRSHSPLDDLESAERRDDLREAMRNLTDENRRTTELFYLQEKTVREVSHILGISPGATRVRLSRSRTLLKELVLRQHETDQREEISMATQSHDQAKEQKCSFCGGSAEELDLLITGPGVNICSSCVQACLHVMTDKHGYSIQLTPKLGESVAMRVSAD